MSAVPVQGQKINPDTWKLGLAWALEGSSLTFHFWSPQNKVWMTRLEAEVWGLDSPGKCDVGKLWALSRMGFKAPAMPGLL